MLRQVVDRIGTLLMGRDRYRRRQYKRAKRIAGRYGYEIYKAHLIWQGDEDYLAARALAARRGIVGIPHDRCYMLLELARQLRDVPGHFAECGSRHGKSSLFLLTGLGADSDKTLHIFDSFDGLSSPGVNDRDAAGAMHWAHRDLAVPEDIVRRNLEGYGDRLDVHKGWIPERFHEVEDERFALVHIDVDLYEPTRDAVAFFYPRVSPGGMIICDDYGSALCPGAKRAIDEFFADKPERVLSLPTGQSLVIKS